MSTSQSLVWVAGGFLGGAIVVILTLWLYSRFRTHPEARNIDQEWKELNDKKP